MSRDQQLLQLRPQLPISSQDSLPLEQFQNQTLRPILKLQNELLVALFKQYLLDKHTFFSGMTPFKQRITIENAIKQNLPIRYTLIGCVAGHFTAEEYTIFLHHKAELTKRITNLLVQRLTDQLLNG